MMMVSSIIPHVAQLRKLQAIYACVNVFFSTKITNNAKDFEEVRYDFFEHSAFESSDLIRLNKTALRRFKGVKRNV